VEKTGKTDTMEASKRGNPKHHLINNPQQNEETKPQNNKSHGGEPQTSKTTPRQKTQQTRNTSRGGEPQRANRADRPNPHTKPKSATIRTNI